MLGLFAFFYGGLHVLACVAPDQSSAWPEIIRDITKRPCIAVGFAAFVALIPLAARLIDAVDRIQPRRPGLTGLRSSDGGGAPRGRSRENDRSMT